MQLGGCFRQLRLQAGLDSKDPLGDLQPPRIQFPAKIGTILQKRRNLLPGAVSRKLPRPGEQLFNLSLGIRDRHAEDL